jgi:hypothetical protein
MDGMAHEGRLRKLFVRPDSKRSWSAVRQLAWKAITFLAPHPRGLPI